MSKAELIAIVQKIANAEYKSDQECELLISELEKNVIDPEVSNLIFYPDLHPKSNGRKNLTSEEIVDIALSYEVRVA